RSHLFVATLDSGASKDITPGDHDVPPFSLGGQDNYAISPDGQEVAFTCNVDQVEATSTNNEIFVVPAGGGTPKKISTSPGSDSTPLYSPNGKWLAWRMQARAGYESDQFQLALYERKTDWTRTLKNDFNHWDHWVENIVWAPDSETIYFTSEDKGEIPIYHVSINPLIYKDNVPKGWNNPQFPTVEIARGADDDLQITPDGKTLVFTRMSVRAPNEIYRLEIGSKEAVQLTHLNDAVLSQVSMQPVESFWFAGAGGTKVQGFLVKPPYFDPQKK